MPQAGGAGLDLGKDTCFSSNFDIKCIWISAFVHRTRAVDVDTMKYHPSMETKNDGSNQSFSEHINPILHIEGSCFFNN